MVAGKLPNIMPGSIIFENILSARVLEYSCALEFKSVKRIWI